MTNTKKLQGLMREKGFTIETLAEKIGISKTGFFNKLHNKAEFVASEVAQLSKLLKINTADMKAIFFANNVE